MNEDQASALFAPARERPVPSATFAMADVFTEAARLRQHRLAASIGSVAAMLIVVLGVSLLAGHGSHRPTPTGQVAHLLDLVRAVPLPADALALATNPLQEEDINAQQPGYVAQQRFWTSEDSPEEAMAIMTSRQPPTLIPGASGSGTTNGLKFTSAYFDADESASVDGPHLSLVAQTLADGRTSLAITAWQILKPAKTPDETVGDVSSATITGDFGTATVTGGEARQLAADVNALWVTVTHPPHGCSGGNIELTFATGNGKQRFTMTCGRVSPEPWTDQPVLLDSAALGNDLGRFFPHLGPTPVPSNPPSPRS